MAVARESSLTFVLFPCVPLSAGSGFGISQSSRLSSSVSAMRVLNPGSDVEEALADALVWKRALHTTNDKVLTLQ